MGKDLYTRLLTVALITARLKFPCLTSVLPKKECPSPGYQLNQIVVIPQQATRQLKNIPNKGERNLFMKWWGKSQDILTRKKKTTTQSSARSACRGRQTCLDRIINSVWEESQQYWGECSEHWAWVTAPCYRLMIWGTILLVLSGINPFEHIPQRVSSSCNHINQHTIRSSRVLTDTRKVKFLIK